MIEDVNKDDKSLIEGCMKGKSLAQEKLFKKYYGLMLAVCLRYANDKSDAHDILQEGFIKIFSKINLFKFQGSFKGWMKRIMVNTAIDRYRKKTNEPYPVEINENLSLVESEDVISKLNSDDLLMLITKLPVGYRTVFNMYVIEGYSHKDIAKELNISENTSKSQLSRARSSLKAKLSKDYGIDE